MVMTSETIFYLIRHGQIDANVLKLWHGSTDSHLNAMGLSQAEEMARHVSSQHPEISAVYCSPLSRTQSTALPLARSLKLDAILDANLREYSIGQLEGTHYEDLAKHHQFYDEIASNQDYAPEGGESINQVGRRMIESFNHLRERHQGQSIAIVSHGAAIGIALAQLLDDCFYPFNDYQMDNTGYSKLNWSADPFLEFFNSKDHLDSMPTST
jgi:broad specificity phosphatase PhoE